MKVRRKKKEISDWYRQCIPCQKSKIHRNIKAPVQHSDIPTKRFGHVNIDLVVPSPTSFHCKDKSFSPTALKNAKFVFVRRDMHRSPLQKPYDGRTKLYKTGKIFFRIQIGNSGKCVTVDLLKPAYLDETEEVELAEPRKRGCPPNKNPIPQDQKVNKESATPKRRGRPPKKKL